MGDTFPCDLTVTFTWQLIGKINILLSEGLLLLEARSFLDFKTPQFFDVTSAESLPLEFYGTQLTKFPQVLTVEPAENMPLYV